MTRYTVEGVRAAITNEDTDWEGSPSELAYLTEKWNGDKERYEYKPVDLPGIGQLTILENVGGGEGDGNERYIVFAVTDYTTGYSRYFRLNGYYASFYGTDWNDLEEVQAVPTVITVWKAIP